MHQGCSKCWDGRTDVQVSSWFMVIHVSEDPDGCGGRLWRGRDTEGMAWGRWFPEEARNHEARSRNLQLC